MAVTALSQLVASVAAGGASSAIPGVSDANGAINGIDFAALLGEQLAPAAQSTAGKSPGSEVLQLLAESVKPEAAKNPVQALAPATQTPGLSASHGIEAADEGTQALISQALASLGKSRPNESNGTAREVAITKVQQRIAVPDAAAPKIEDPSSTESQAALPPLAASSQNATQPVAANVAPDIDGETRTGKEDSHEEASLEPAPQAMLNLAPPVQAQGHPDGAMRENAEFRGMQAPAHQSLPQAAPQTITDPAAASRQDGSDTANLAAPASSSEDSLPNFASVMATQRPEAAPTSTPVQSAAVRDIPVSLQDHRWAGHVGEQVVWMAKHEQQSAQININPPQLGPLQITLNLNGDQASAMFVSPHAEVRQAIQDAMPQLRDMLATSGINLGQANVGSQTPDQQRELAFQFANQNRARNEDAILPADKQTIASSGALPIHRGRGMVDLFA